MVRHFGVFKFKPGINEEQIDQCFLTMKAMVGENRGFAGYGIWSIQ